MSVEILKEIIIDYQEQELLSGIPRNLTISPMKNKATICIGVRRSGKSTFMFQKILSLKKQGVKSSNILYLNFFDDRLHFLHHKGLSIILDAYFSLYPDKKNTETLYCFFDEIQIIKNWEAFVDRIMRTEKCEVYITGSSAQMLSKEVATQMRGRALSWELFPFSFSEFLLYRGIESNVQLTSKKRYQIQKAFDDYRECGGFPEVAGLNRQLRIKTHQEYFNTMLFRDLIERHDISHPKAVIDLAHWFIDNVSCMYTINSLTRHLKSLGHSTPKNTVIDFIKWFEDAYFFFTVRMFDASSRKSNANPKKIYCVDHSMVSSVGSGILVNSGHLLENLVFSALRRIYTDIFYYKTKGGREVDFLVKREDKKRSLIQVSESIIDPSTRKREVDALNEAMKELKIKTSTIVTLTTDEKIKTEYGEINVISAWKFTLGRFDFRFII